MEHNHPALSLTQWSTGHESQNTISSIYIVLSTGNYIIISIEPPDGWPTMPAAADAEADKECQTQKVHLGICSEAEWPNIPEPAQFQTWRGFNPG